MNRPCCHTPEGEAHCKSCYWYDAAKDGPLTRVKAADVLAHVNEFAGQENDAEEVRDFVQASARMIAEGNNRYRDFGMAGYAGFIEWLSEREA